MVAAAVALRDVVAGHHLDLALDRVLADPRAVGLPRLPDVSRPVVRDIAYAAVRRLGRLRVLAGRLNSRQPAPLLAALQQLALLQLMDERRPAPVVIDQAVDAAGRLPEGLGTRFSAGFLNATLRRFMRERATLLAAIEHDPVARHDHPGWWLDLLRAHYPQTWAAVARESLAHAPLTLRVNRRRLDVATALQRLAAAGLDCRRTGDEALTLAVPVPVARIPGFADGDFTVQDAGAQLAAPLLAPAAGTRVLDACAAPGGKTTHLLQYSDCAVLALDVDPRRIDRIRENLAREGLPEHPAWPPPGWGAVVRAGDAAEPAGWWDGQPFDHILVDAPCSASGIVRRHPDVLWHRQRRDIATLAGQQRWLLDALWPLLKPGGTLLYVTCSIFPDEGEAVIAAFCERHVDCRRVPVVVSWVERPQRLLQLLPTRSPDRDHDGFSYALLSKRP